MLDSSLANLGGTTLTTDHLYTKLNFRLTMELADVFTDVSTPEVSDSDPDENEVKNYYFSIKISFKS